MSYTSYVHECHQQPSNDFYFSSISEGVRNTNTTVGSRSFEKPNGFRNVLVFLKLFAKTFSAINSRWKSRRPVAESRTQRPLAYSAPTRVLGAHSFGTRARISRATPPGRARGVVGPSGTRPRRLGAVCAVRIRQTPRRNSATCRRALCTLCRRAGDDRTV